MHSRQQLPLPCLLKEDDRTGTGALQMSLGGRHNQQEVPCLAVNVEKPKWF